MTSNEPCPTCTIQVDAMRYILRRGLFCCNILTCTIFLYLHRPPKPFPCANVNPVCPQYILNDVLCNPRCTHRWVFRLRTPFLCSKAGAPNPAEGNYYFGPKKQGNELCDYHTAVSNCTCEQSR